MLKYVRQRGSGAGMPGPPVPRRLRPAVDVRGRAYARFLAALDGRLDRIYLELQRLSRELAAAEERLSSDAASAAEPQSAVGAAESVERAGAHLLFVPGPSGYSLLVQPGPVPVAGTEVELRELGRAFLVAKLGPAPLPGDPRRCAYLLG
jgi:hypothetical protein